MPQTILPCPFCAWLSPLIQFGEHDIRVWCPNCHATGPQFDDSEYDEDKAVECWNLRREPSVTQEQDTSKRISEDFSRALDQIHVALPTSEHAPPPDGGVMFVYDTQGGIIPLPPPVVTEESLGPPRRVNDLDMLVFLEKWCKPDSNFSDIRAEFETLIFQASRYASSESKIALARRGLAALHAFEEKGSAAQVEAVRFILDNAVKP